MSAGTTPWVRARMVTNEVPEEPADLGDQAHDGIPDGGDRREGHADERARR